MYAWLNSGSNTIAYQLDSSNTGNVNLDNMSLVLYSTVSGSLPGANQTGAGAQTIYTTQTPASSDNYARYELGTKFKANVDGTVTKVRIYTNATEGGDHTVRIWTAASSVVAGPYTWTITSGTAGWKEYTLPASLSITANTDYIVSVSNSTPGCRICSLRKDNVAITDLSNNGDEILVPQLLN